jgi:ribosome-associated heat shock protein Hsp15
MVGEGRQRVDKWLFFSRAVKSRSLAAKIVVAGRVRINRDKAAQASDTVKPGDVLTVTLEGRILVWKVLSCGTRRGPADEARLLYEDMSPAPTPKDEAVADAIPALRDAGSGRPTKRERRQTDRLLGDD